ncbi:hypothetical protein POM88_035595 [Heracleum sosnowskyi]|uniref:Uncharacterized protein n=1 Tax=Heracleum sosnowskyi TaxID=360622 RepID=A0AAD8HLN1_9APIA|nr:hypothetical protein POM88_035592 [Heracleum sosnowskyi]KAK1369503.1 hypothetical protein POM88_035595 [Heracleum sosnowskyi]
MAAHVLDSSTSTGYSPGLLGSSPLDIQSSSSSGQKIPSKNDVSTPLRPVNPADFDTDIVPSQPPFHAIEPHSTDHTSHPNSPTFSSVDPSLHHDPSSTINPSITSSRVESCPIPVRRSTRVKQLPPKLHDYVLSNAPSNATFHSAAYNVYADPTLSKMDKPYLDSLHQVLSVHEPSSYAKAKSDPKWVQAMQDELDALDNNDT